jgi:predicted acyltransferase
MSLDALRGFDMFWIIGGEHLIWALGPILPSSIGPGLAKQFDHVKWEGLHVYDLIWPVFMFIVGVAMPLSLANRRARGDSNGKILFHAVKRSAILFILGMIAQGDLLQYDLSKLHPCYSVLHGIAAGYLIATIVMLLFGPKLQAAATVAFLLIYWALLMWIPVPGVGAGVLTPDGNAAIYIDKLVLGHFQFDTNTWFLSYLGFAASVLLGVLAGELLMSPRSQRAKVLGLLSFGIVLIALGLLWSIWFPIIKLIWTSSFVLVGGGVAAILLAVFYLIIDVCGWRRWAFFFTVIGMNSIAVYMATTLFGGDRIFQLIGNIFVGSLLPRVGQWSDVLQAVAELAVVWLILLWMYRKKTFIRL